MKIQMKDRDSLRYKPSKLEVFLQVGSVFLFFFLLASLAWRLVINRTYASPVYGVLAFLLAQLSSDFVGGLIHWAFDTWGTDATPLFGSFIRAFREHHVDQKQITHHSFFITSGTSGIPIFPVQIGALLFPISSELSYFAILYLTLLTGISFCTNLFHKWAHMDTPPFIARLLQRCHLILTLPNHDKHHTEPFNKSYCITNGWMNPFLTALGFFHGFEWVVTKVTGAIPRVDDIGIEAAQLIAREQGII